MTPRCLVVGSVNVDLLGCVPRLCAPDEAVDVERLAVAAGGHAGNCATALARLGVAPRLGGCIGDDVLGTLMLERLVEGGVDVDYVERTTAAMTGVVFVAVLPGGDKTLYMARGANLRMSAEPLSRAAEGCEGLLIFDPPHSVFERLSALARDRLGVFAPGGVLCHEPPEVLAPLLDAVRVLVVNAPEGTAMSGGLPAAEAANKLSRRWGVVVIVTTGAGGCWVAGPEPVRHIPSFSLSVVDTTGAGDAFVAGLSAAMLGGQSLTAAVRHAVAAGALATRRLGAQASLADSAEIAALVNGHSAVGRAGKGRPALARSADGWRGLIGVDFSRRSVIGTALAIGEELRSRFGVGEVIVAHDARRLSVEAAAAAAAALAELGLRPQLLSGAPTPTVVNAVRAHGYLGALVVTASHNDAAWNGVKLKVRPGIPPSAELEAAIERRRASDDDVVDPVAGVDETLDARAIRTEHVCALLEHVEDEPLRRAGLRVVVDGLDGVGGELLAEMAQLEGCEVRMLGGDGLPDFGGVVPDPMRPNSRQRIVNGVVHWRADVGFVLDGDGDRLGVIDETGSFLWPHEVLALLLPVVDERRPGGGDVATTVATGSLPRRVAQALGRDVQETAVGFKHMAPLLWDGRCVAAGGGVGDFGFRNLGFDRDPYLAALMLLELLAKSKRPLRELRQEVAQVYGASSYVERAFPGRLDSPNDIESAGLEALACCGLDLSLQEIDWIDGAKFRLVGGDWLLLRASTTEDVTRAIVECSSEDRARELLGALATALEVR